MNFAKWKQERIDSIKESIRFFSNENKFEREKYIVRALLTALNVEYEEDELVRAAEPVDVGFRGANFQVKEVMQPERRRGDEYKKALERAQNAKSCEDLSQLYSPVDLTLREIVGRSVDRSKELENKYGPLERGAIDLVCYVNFLDTNEVLSEFDSHETPDFRSICIVSNRFRLIFHATHDAPKYLKENVGDVFCN